MKKTTVFALGIIFICLFSCNDTAPKVEPVIIPTDWATHKTKEFSIQYPKDWELSQTGEMGTSFVLFAPLLAKQDPFKENVNLITQDLAGQEISLEDYTVASEDQIKKMLSKSKIISNEVESVNGLEYNKLIYTGTQGAFDLQYEQFYWIENEKAYILTFTTEQREFSDMQLLGEKIMKTFKLKA
jgi:hypothetical protein